MKFSLFALLVFSLNSQAVLPGKVDLQEGADAVSKKLKPCLAKTKRFEVSYLSNKTSQYLKKEDFIEAFAKTQNQKLSETTKIELAIQETAMSKKTEKTSQLDFVIKSEDKEIKDCLGKVTLKKTLTW